MKTMKLSAPSLPPPPPPSSSSSSSPSYIPSSNSSSEKSDSIHIRELNKYILFKNMNWITSAPFLNSKEESIELFRYLRLYPTAAKTPSYVCICGHSLRQEVDGGYKCGYRWRCSN
jgi:hypothetical protein